MACYRAIGAAGYDIAWAGDGSDAIWVQDNSVHDSPDFDLRSLSFGLLDTVGGDCTTDQYSAAAWFTVDDDGHLFWAEYGSTPLVLPTLPHGIAVYSIDIATNVSTQLFTLTAAGGTTDANRRNHEVTGLEWNQAEGRIYLAWHYSRTSAEEYHVASFLPDGSGYTDHISGTTGSGSPGGTFPDYVGPIVFDPDGVSMWLRAKRLSTLPVLYRIGHVELGTYTASNDPTAGESLAHVPGIPRSDGLVYPHITGDVWRTVTYDDPGFTLTDASCPDHRSFIATAYSQAPFSDDQTAFTYDGDLWVPGSGDWRFNVHWPSP